MNKGQIMLDLRLQKWERALSEVRDPGGFLSRGATQSNLYVQTITVAVMLRRAGGQGYCSR